MADGLNRKERIAKAIALEIPDRVPCCPQIDYMAGNLAGITPAEFIADLDAANRALELAFDELGGWDWLYPGYAGNLFVKSAPLIMRIPGVDLPEDSTHQVVEKEIMTADDYDFVINNGYQAFREMIFRRMGKKVNREETLAMLSKMRELGEKWEQKGVPLQKAGTHFLPFELFCMLRSFDGLVKDLFLQPDKLMEASKVIIDDIIQEIRNGCAALNNQAFWFGGWRGGATFISPRVFEKHYFPCLKKAADQLLDEGYTPLFHLDADWTPMLDYFNEFPKGKCVMQLDGSTDIREAKRIVGDKICLMGDVPPTLLSVGKAKEVEDYCRRLIEDIAPGGGFILGSGCTVPPDAKTENVRALIESVEKYGSY
jgi:hypothetical protein